MMTLGLLYWILMILWFFFGLWWNWPGNNAGTYGPVGNTLLLFILFLINGIHDFGSPFH